SRTRRPHHQRLRGVRRRYQGTTGGPPMSSDNPGQDSAGAPDRGAGSPHQGEDSPHREGPPHLEAALALARAKSSLDTAIGTMLSRVGLSLEDLRRLRLIGARPQGLGRDDLAEAMGEPRSHAGRYSLPLVHRLGSQPDRRDRVPDLGPFGSGPADVRRPAPAGPRLSPEPSPCCTRRQMNAAATMARPAAAMSTPVSTWCRAAKTATPTAPPRVRAVLPAPEANPGLRYEER